MFVKSTGSLLVFGLMTLAAPVTIAQVIANKDCSSGRVNIPEDNARVYVQEYCAKINVAGSGNTITILRAGDLKVGGDNNTINYFEKSNGAEPKHWFGGKGNKLVYIGEGSTPSKSKPSKSTRKNIQKNTKTAKRSKPQKAVIFKPVKKSSKAPLLVDIPGPRVKRTGKMLGSLPAGYRMHVSTTNYWTNKSMTATSLKHLHLTRDGQFELGRYSISGSLDNSVGTITTANKIGKTGTVLGSTDPGTSRGGKSVYLKKRDGLDPAMYGTYYISGNQIELRYASGKTVKHAFKTDGYKTLVLDKKRYFSHAPDGWERKSGKYPQYRSLDGSYTATVTKIKKSVPNGKEWLQDYIKRGKSKNFIVSATPVKVLKGKRLGVVKSTMVIRDQDNGKTYKHDMYVRYGRNSTVSRFIRVTRYKGASGDADLLEFINDL